MALQLAVKCLHGATVGWRHGNVSDRQGKVLENKISLSKHSFIDIVDALADTSLSTGFKLVSVLLEQMAYKTNPNCQYPTK